MSESVRPQKPAAEDDEHQRSVRAVRALARVSRVVERASADLSLAHYRVLSAVASGDQRASRLAERLALGKPTISAAVDALCRRGLLLRAEVAEDQRAVALSLTEQGRRLLDEVETEMIARIGELCAQTPDGARVLESLDWLGDALEAQRRAGRGRQDR
jgi:DNA-binding MarR family transcriptional regulator